MHLIRPADIVHAALQTDNGHYPGVFACQGGSCEHRGWYVPVETVHVQRYPRPPMECRHVHVRLLVIDDWESASTMQWIPFRVDMGSPITIIPQVAIENGNIFRHNAVIGIDEVLSVRSEKILGNNYSAVLQIGAPHLSEPAIVLRLPVFVTSFINLPYGLLGMDALKLIDMSLDDAHCTFCPVG